MSISHIRHHKGSVPPVGLAHPMRTVADRSILGQLSSVSPSFSSLSLSSFSNDQLEQMHIYGGGGQVGLQLQISVNEFLRLSNADIVDIGSSLSDDCMVRNDQQQTSVDGDILEKISSFNNEERKSEADTSKQIENRNRVGFNNRNIERDAAKEIFLFQPSVAKKSGVSNNNNPAINSLKMARKEKWLVNSNAEAFSIFDTKLLRDYAMLEDNTSFFRMLCLYDASPESFSTALESATPSGKTALHLAAWKGPVENVRALIERGANVNTHSTSPGNYGKSAIFYAITRSRDDMVLELLRQGAKVKIVNNKGQTPLSLAVSHLEEETILLIEKAENVQGALPWANFRLSHSDCKPYGDLDPRFLDDVNSGLNPFQNTDDDGMLNEVTAAVDRNPLVSARVRSIYPTSENSRGRMCNNNNRNRGILQSSSPRDEWIPESIGTYMDVIYIFQ